MDTNTFFINALRSQAHYKRAWMIRTFGVALDDPNTVTGELPPWTVLRTATNVQVKLPDGQMEILEEAKLGEPVLSAKSVIFVPPKFFEFWPEGGFTTAGNLVYNSCCLWPVVGAKFGYINERVDERKIEAKFAEAMIDDPEDPSQKDPNLIYVSDWLQYGRAIKYQEEFSSLFVWTLSENSIVPSDEVLKRKEELLAEAQANGTIGDPVTQAKIFKELEDLDSKQLAQDPGAAFITSGKSKLVRRKLTSMYGAEQGLDVSQKPLLITQSLHDGLRPEHLVDVMNVSRAGSFDRGAETMYGGVEAKWGDRVMQGSKVVAEDCGSQLGYTYEVTPRTIANTIGRWMFTSEGVKLIEDKHQAMALIGQTIKVRAPNRCKAAPLTKWCTVCLGAQLSANPRALGLSVSAYGSGFLQLSLQSMHAKATVLVRLKVRQLMS